jgi:UDP-GlcNAc:undecaprenyl-phosphate GlcNAc-1-phosphate transferase
LYLNSQRDNSITSISYLSLVLIPILDMIRLFCLRLYSRKSPFEKDLNHFHHIILQKSNLFFTISIYLLLSFLPFILVVYNYLDPVFAIIIQITSFFGLIYYYLKK